MHTTTSGELAEAKTFVKGLIDKARAAMEIIKDYDQEGVDRICQAVGWNVVKDKHIKHLARLSVEETGMGDYESRYNGKRFKIYGVLRDILGVKTVGVIEEIPEKGIVKYAKPVGVIAAIIPMTNPEVTPPAQALFALKCKDAVICSPHPRAKKTTFEAVRLVREALEKVGAPPDLVQCIPEPTMLLGNELMKQADLVIATGGKGLVKAAYSSGTPAYGVGPGNVSIIVDETADIEETARNIVTSNTFDNHSGCSCDSNIIAEQTIYDRLLARLQEAGGYLTSAEEKASLKSIMRDAKGNINQAIVAVPASKVAELAGFSIPKDKKLLIVEVHENEVDVSNPFCLEKLSVVLAVYKCRGFENALKLLLRMLEYWGTGHSCGIYSHDENRIHQLASSAKVSRIMVRQPQVLANSGSFTNGMPMTLSLGCGTWGGNITSENIHLKHYMNVTWVSRRIPENRPPDEVLFGEFLDT